MAPRALDYICGGTIWTPSLSLFGKTRVTQRNGSESPLLGLGNLVENLLVIKLFLVQKHGRTINLR